MQTDYTPEGSYMTYEGGENGGSMVKYTITMVFQELDPIYADDYERLNDENDYRLLKWQSKLTSGTYQILTMLIWIQIYHQNIPELRTYSKEEN